MLVTILLFFSLVFLATAACGAGSVAGVQTFPLGVFLFVAAQFLPLLKL